MNPAATALGPDPGPDLRAEAALADGLSTDGCLPAEFADGGPRRVLLTGATGFLGAFLLRAFLDRTRAEVWCLVRAGSDAQARARIEEVLSGYGLWDEALRHRIVPVRGDLEQPLLGVGEARFATLAELVDLVCHCGARVNHLDRYPRLRAANVLGTLDVLRLASTWRLKPVLHVSTGSAAVAVGPNPEVLPEEQRVPAATVVPSGYVQSKWVAEELVHAAADRGVPATVFRPGRVSGHSATGACGSDDSFWNFVRAVVLLGAMPQPPAAERAEVETDLVPVDHVVGAVLQLGLDPRTAGRTYHLVNPSPPQISTVLEELLRCGYRLDRLPAGKWEPAMTELAERTIAEGDFSLLPALLLSRGFLGEPLGLRLGRTRTRRALAGSAVPAPTVDGSQLRRTIGYFIRTGFLPPPGQPGV